MPDDLIDTALISSQNAAVNSVGELLAQGKNNIDAWWISMSTFVVLVVTLLLLTFMGDALRDALDPRKVDA